LAVSPAAKATGDTMRHLFIAVIALGASLFVAVSRAHGIY
jgi:hypothetical protein